MLSHPSQSDPARAIADRIAALDLSSVLIMLTHPVWGQGWTLERAQQAIAHYRLFLTCCAVHPETALVPSTDVDQAWHCHILDTHKYQQDCLHCFGRFIHHNPHTGRLNPQQWRRQWQYTIRCTAALRSTASRSLPTRHRDRASRQIQPAGCTISHSPLSAPQPSSGVT